MKIQYRVAVSSFLIIIICAALSFLFVFFKDQYDGKWSDYLVAVFLGLLTNSVLIFVISIINFYQIRRDRSRKIIIELNIFQTEYCMLNALILPYCDDAGIISIPEPDLEIIQNLLVRLDDISIRTLYLDRISISSFSFVKNHPIVCSNISKIETSFFKKLSEFTRLCHEAYNLFRLAYNLRLKSDAIQEMFKTRFQNVMQSIAVFSIEDSEFNMILKKYMEINYTILKITEAELIKHASQN